MILKETLIDFNNVIDWRKLIYFNFDFQNIFLYSATPIIKHNAKPNTIHNYLGLYLGCLVNGK